MSAFCLCTPIPPPTALETNWTFPRTTEYRALVLGMFHLQMWKENLQAVRVDIKGYERRQTERQTDRQTEGCKWWSWISSVVSYVRGVSIFSMPYLRPLFEQQHSFKANRIFIYRAAPIPGAISPSVMNFVRCSPIFFSPQYWTASCQSFDY
jgi:hypothetical protein